ncbi:MAG: hypothetical protein LE178_03150, partial [Endomicrobium sp.]|nr:hypothetical protein [Endomicrobium sp.]
MMTLHLRRCVSLLVCLSLLVSACSPDKSSKAGSKVNEFNRMTKVDKNSVEKIANHVASAVNKNNVTPVSFWNRELGKVGGVSITPKRVAIGTGAVLGTATVLYIGYKWYKKHQILITVPPGSKTQSIEETNAIEKAITTVREIEEIEDTIRKEIPDKKSTEYKTFIEKENDNIRQNINSRSTKAAGMFNILINTIDVKTKTKSLTPEIMKEMLELVEEDYVKNNYMGYSKDWWRNFLTTHENIAKFVKTNETTLPRNLRNCIKKFTSANVMATRLATLRKIGTIWDTEEIRQNLKDRKLKINEEVVLNTITI